MAASLQLLRVDFSYHNSYVMSRLAVTTQTFGIDSARILTIRLLEQGYAATRLKSSLQNFYGRHSERCYGVSTCTRGADLFNVS